MVRKYLKDKFFNNFINKSVNKIKLYKALILIGEDKKVQEVINMIIHRINEKKCLHSKDFNFKFGVNNEVEKINKSKIMIVDYNSCNLMDDFRNRNIIDDIIGISNKKCYYKEFPYGIFTNSGNKCNVIITLNKCDTITEDLKQTGHIIYL